MLSKLLDSLRSRTVIAALVTLAAVIAQAFGFGSLFADQEAIVNGTLQVVNVAGPVLAIWFRVTPQWKPQA